MNKLHRIIAISSFALLSVSAFATEMVHLNIKSSNPKAFLGPATFKDAKGWYKGAVESPRDIGSGQASGKRIIVVRFRPADTKGAFQQALQSNEVLKEVKIAIKDASGKMKIATLSKPKISKVVVNSATEPPIEEVSFTYQDITWTFE
ncbi:MAG TPA: type VI secretion system tube protein Hcp [Fimbriimonas sp.]|nr:type VI secretion system tube protein Hcp [Fimbriimonas sp.]